MKQQPIKILTWITSGMISELMLGDIHTLMENAKTPDTHLTWVPADAFPNVDESIYHAGAVVVWKGPAKTSHEVLAQNIMRTEIDGLDEE